MVRKRARSLNDEKQLTPSKSRGRARPVLAKERATEVRQPEETPADDQEAVAVTATVENPRFIHLVQGINPTPMEHSAFKMMKTTVVVSQLKKIA